MLVVEPIAAIHFMSSVHRTGASAQHEKSQVALKTLTSPIRSSEHHTSRKGV
jgi:hypothetical protein